MPYDIKTYSQYVPIQYGDLKLYINIINGTGVPEVTINGVHIDQAVENECTVRLNYEILKEMQKQRINITIDFSGGKRKLMAIIPQSQCADEAPIHLLPGDLQKIYRTCVDKYDGLNVYERAGEYGVFLLYVIDSFRTAAKRRVLPFDKENFRMMTQQKQDEIISLYDASAMNLYMGLKHHYT